MTVLDFELMLPEGWVILSTQDHQRTQTDAAIEKIIMLVLPSDLPRDSVEPWRRELRRHLTHAVDEARETGARSVGLPIAPMDGVVIPASFCTAVVDDPDVKDAEQLLAGLLADAGADGSFHEIGDGPAVRVESVVSEQGPGGSYDGPTRRVAYYLPHPDVAGCWAVTTFTTLADGDPRSPFADALVVLFDAIMSTMRWREVEVAGAQR
ncbi:hypothetical protein [Frankia sp. CiP3]|uniref:hypothetical protein n=1 Tax=Frankia sp. CiP3 TaxID=2880971 RepID=UPI001EF686F7|nr:hypothetical protein [Frankia sp. CiP3]